MLGASGGVCRLSPIDAQNRRNDVQRQHRLAGAQPEVVQLHRQVLAVAADSSAARGG